MSDSDILMWVSYSFIVLGIIYAGYHILIQRQIDMQEYEPLKYLETQIVNRTEYNTVANIPYYQIEYCKIVTANDNYYDQQLCLCGLVIDKPYFLLKDRGIYCKATLINETQEKVYRQVPLENGQIYLLDENMTQIFGTYLIETEKVIFETVEVYK